MPSIFHFPFIFIPAFSALNAIRHHSNLSWSDNSKRGINTIPFTDCNDEFLKCQSDNLLNYKEQNRTKEKWMWKWIYLEKNPFNHSFILNGDRKILKNKWLYFWISRKQGFELIVLLLEGWIFAHVCKFFSNLIVMFMSIKDLKMSHKIQLFNVGTLYFLHFYISICNFNDNPQYKNLFVFFEGWTEYWN